MYGLDKFECILQLAISFEAFTKSNELSDHKFTSVLVASLGHSFPVLILVLVAIVISS